MLVIVLLGALAAGFTTGFAGFGTGLVASDLWFHPLPASMVPPLAALASVAAQSIGIITVRKAFDWNKAQPFLLGGLIGVPLGIAALVAASPFWIWTAIATFLIAYAAYQLVWRSKRSIGSWGGRRADSAVGIAGGFLGGFAGLSGQLPLIWLHMRGGDTNPQRAIYQPFNVVVLTLATIGMAVSGQLTTAVLTIALPCLPTTLLGAWRRTPLRRCLPPDFPTRHTVTLASVGRHSPRPGHRRLSAPKVQAATLR